MSATLKRDMIIDSEHGLHMRAAAMLARTANDFQADISVCHGCKIVNGKSTMGLMTLGAEQSERITVQAIGVDASSALDAIQDLLCADAFVHQSVA